MARLKPSGSAAKTAPLRKPSEAKQPRNGLGGMRYAPGKGAENARLRYDKVYFQPASRSRSAMLFQHIGQPHQFGGKLYPGRASPNDSNRKMVVRGDRLKHCDTQPLAEGNGFAPAIDRHEIGRASCRERVWKYV